MTGEVDVAGVEVDEADVEVVVAGVDAVVVTATGIGTLGPSHLPRKLPVVRSRRAKKGNAQSNLMVALILECEDRLSLSSRVPRKQRRTKPHSMHTRM